MKNDMPVDAVGAMADDDVCVMPEHPATARAIDAARPLVSRVIAILLGWVGPRRHALRAFVNTQVSTGIPRTVGAGPAGGRRGCEA
jgi:hypothetical protein